jgi:hypothetical protein
MFLVFWRYWNIQILTRRKTSSSLNICSCRANKTKNSAIIEMQLIQMCGKEYFSFKMIMNTSAVYLELHTCISLLNNCQRFVPNSPGHTGTYSSLLPLDAINFINITTQKRAGLLYIWWTQSHSLLCILHLANDCKMTHRRISIYTQCKTFRQRRGIFKVRLLCLVQLWNVFLLSSSSAPKINTPLWFCV